MVYVVSVYLISFSITPFISLSIYLSITLSIDG